MLHHAAGRFGDLDIFVRGADRLSVRELERRSAVLARGLLASGLGKGSRVAVMMPNSPDFAVAFAAASRIGAVVVPLSTLYQAAELRWVLHHADVGALLISDRYLSHDYQQRLELAFPTLAGQAAQGLFLPEAPFLRRIFVWGAADRSWALPGESALIEAAAAAPAIDEAFLDAVEAAVAPADPFCTIYTSGSTADPKGVVHNHGPIIRHTYGLSPAYYPFGPGERIVGTRQWFWIAGLSSGYLGAIQSGLCTIIPETDSGEEGAELLLRENVTLVGHTPDYYARIAAALKARGEDVEVFAVMLGIAGVARRASPQAEWRFISADLEDRIPARFMPAPVDRQPNFLGMTETLAGHTTEPLPAMLPPGKEGASGRGMFGLERKIIDPQTGRELPRGEAGELAVRGPPMMAGFHKIERANVFERDGFYRTGDLCLIDEDDCLTIKGRLSEMVKISGANVSPLEVERTVMGLGGFDQCVVLGLDRPGEKTLLAAVVTPAPNTDPSEAELIARLKTLLSSFKVPKRIFFMRREEIPATANGKVRKQQLAPLLVERMAAERGEAAVAD